jgi:acyl-CoA reductase-like NAD-dependent aldehyde dehydrogenase
VETRAHVRHHHPFLRRPRPHQRRTVAARDGQTFDCISPVDGRLLTQVARCGQADIDAAVAAARAAFEDRRWAGKAPARASA